MNPPKYHIHLDRPLYLASTLGLFAMALSSLLGWTAPLEPHTSTALVFALAAGVFALTTPYHSLPKTLIKSHPKQEVVQ